MAGLIVDDQSGPWYVEAGTIPDEVEIGDGVYYSTGGAGGRPYYLPSADYPDLPWEYSMVKKNNAYNTYTGIDFVLNKRLSNKWFMNASFTLQDQRNHWGTNFLDPTNQWMSDGKPYGLWGGGASGKTAVLMYTRWMAKISALYQLPYGFDVSGTINAREGWKVPNYFYMYDYDAPNPAQRVDHRASTPRKSPRTPCPRSTTSRCVWRRGSTSAPAGCTSWRTCSTC